MQKNLLDLSPINSIAKKRTSLIHVVNFANIETNSNNNFNLVLIILKYISRSCFLGVF